MVKSLHLLMATALIATACAADALTTEPTPNETSAPRAMAVDATGSPTCPLTIPPEPGFMPPAPFPSEAPPLYQAVWYGTSELWTMLDPDGAVWGGLPQGEDGTLGDKTFWWSDDYSVATEPLTITGRRLDSSGSFEAKAGGPGPGGFREDIGSFILVGVEIPAGGCWELTARYRDVELTYVIAVNG